MIEGLKENAAKPLAWKHKKYDNIRQQEAVDFWSAQKLNSNKSERPVN
jgi:hypothetical protein